MKDLIKSQKFLIGIIMILILILIVMGILLFKKSVNKNKENQTIINDYVAYVKINPSIKLQYSQTCDKADCSNPIVIGYELINDDAKNIYKDVNLTEKDTDLFNVLELITQIAKDNNINFNTVEIYTDWKNIDEYVEQSQKNSSGNWNYNVNVSKKEELNEIEKTLEDNNVTNNEEAQQSNGNIESNSDNNTNNKKTNSNQNNTSNTDQEPQEWTNIGGDIYYNGASTGYGDYIKHYDEYTPQGRYITKFISTSKMGCKDANDKQACKTYWVNYWTPKVEETKKDYDRSVSTKNEYVDMIKKNGYLEQYPKYKELIAKCESGDTTECYDENQIRDSYNFLKTVYENYDKNIAEFDDIIFQYRSIYEEHLKALNIYKAL